MGEFVISKFWTVLGWATFAVMAVAAAAMLATL
jgi:hypothetical protein